MINQEELKELLHYDPLTGVFIRLTDLGGQYGRVGSRAGTPLKKGYVAISVYNKRYLAHRLAHLYMVGRWPTKQVDHINGIKNDNRWCNLREANNATNHHNTGIRRNNTSGTNNVVWRKDRNKWRVTLVVNCKRHYVGLFTTKEEATIAREKAAKSLHGEFYHATA